MEFENDQHFCWAQGVWGGWEKMWVGIGLGNIPLKREAGRPLSLWPSCGVYVAKIFPWRKTLWFICRSYARWENIFPCCVESCTQWNGSFYSTRKWTTGVPVVWFFFNNLYILIFITEWIIKLKTKSRGFLSRLVLNACIFYYLTFSRAHHSNLSISILAYASENSLGFLSHTPSAS